MFDRPRWSLTYTGIGRHWCWKSVLTAEAIRFVTASFGMDTRASGKTACFTDRRCSLARQPRRGGGRGVRQYSSDRSRVTPTAQKRDMSEVYPRDSGLTFSTTDLSPTPPRPKKRDRHASRADRAPRNPNALCADPLSNNDEAKVNLISGRLAQHPGLAKTRPIVAK